MASGSEPEAQRARVSLPANTREAESCASSPCRQVSELPSANTPPSGARAPALTVNSQAPCRGQPFPAPAPQVFALSRPRCSPR